jgi:hypothetical protein
MMGFGKDPCFEWKSRGKGSNGEEGFILSDDTLSPLDFLPDDVTKNASIFIIKIGFASLDLFAHSFWYDREGDNLRMGMFQGGSCRDAMVFKDENISKALVTP